MCLMIFLIKIQLASLYHSRDARHHSRMYTHTLCKDKEGCQAKCPNSKSHNARSNLSEAQKHTHTHTVGQIRTTEKPLHSIDLYGNWTVSVPVKQHRCFHSMKIYNFFALSLVFFFFIIIIHAASQ